VYEDRVLQRIFVPKRRKVVGGWRMLHNEELHNLYTSTNVIKVIKPRRMRWSGACSMHGTDEKFIQNFGP
jgi:hypothetical protein